MSPKDKNIIDTLNLLTLLLRARKQQFPKLTEEEQHILTINKGHIASIGLLIPVFANTLEILSQKGYLVSVNIIDNKLHSQIKESFSDQNYQKILKEFEKLDATATGKINNLAADAVERMLPPGYAVNREELLKKPLSFKEAFEDAHEFMKNHSSEDVSNLWLMPFRSIDKLLEKMNAGITFDDIQDDGFWYESKAYKFHIDGKIIETIYNNKSNKEHYVLERIFNNSSLKKAYYDDLATFEPSSEEAKELSAFRDACARFIKKHPKLSQLFTAHINYMEFHPDRYK